MIIKTINLKSVVLFGGIIAGVLLGAVVFVPSAMGQNVVWVNQFGTSGGDIAEGISVDGSGNSYVVGRTDGVFPGQINAGGGSDAFIRKYDVNGNVVWTHQFGSPDYDGAFGVSTHTTGVYVVGQARGVLPGSTQAGHFIRKYKFDGTVAWTRQKPSGYTGSSNIDTTNIAYGVIASSEGVYVAGTVRGILPGQTNANENQNDAFLEKYDVDGNLIWTRQFGTADDDRAFAVTVDLTGVYVTGRTFVLPPGQVTGTTTIFVRKYDFAGNEVWARQFAGDSAEGISAFSGGVYVTGNFYPLTGVSNEVFVRKYDTNGTLVWVSEFGTSASDLGNAVSADASGVYVGGLTMGTLPGQTSSGAGHDLFVRNLNASNGSELWTKQFGSPSGEETILGISVDPTGAYATGYTRGEFTGQLFLGGFSDAFVAKLSVLPPPDSTPPETIIATAKDGILGGNIVTDGGSTISTSMTFSFGGTDDITPPASLTFQCSLDGAAFTSCTNPIVYTALAIGPHTFSVAAMDAAGNVDATPATWNWTVAVDTDLDSVVDPLDNCPAKHNPLQGDTDLDGVGNVCDVCPFDSTNTCNDPGKTGGSVLGSLGGLINSTDSKIKLTAPASAVSVETEFYWMDAGIFAGFITGVETAFFSALVPSIRFAPEGTTFSQPVNICFNEVPLYGGTYNCGNITLAKDALPPVSIYETLLANQTCSLNVTPADTAKLCGDTTSFTNIGAFELKDLTANFNASFLVGGSDLFKIIRGGVIGALIEEFVATIKRVSPGFLNITTVFDTLTNTGWKVSQDNGVTFTTSLTGPASSITPLAMINLVYAKFTNGVMGDKIIVKAIYSSAANFKRLLTYIYEFIAGDPTPPPAPTPVVPVVTPVDAHLIDYPTGQETLIPSANLPYINNSYPTFDWSDVTDPSGVTYTLQVDNNLDFSSPEINVTGLLVSQYTHNLPLADGEYNWRVQAVDGAGNVSANSVAVPFVIDTISPAMANFTMPTPAAELIMTANLADANLNHELKLDVLNGADTFIGTWRVPIFSNDFAGMISNDNFVDANGVSLSDGTYTFKPRVFDLAGNKTTGMPVTVVLDRDTDNDGVRNDVETALAGSTGLTVNTTGVAGTLTGVFNSPFNGSMTISGVSAIFGNTFSVILPAGTTVPSGTLIMNVINVEGRQRIEIQGVVLPAGATKSVTIKPNSSVCIVDSPLVGATIEGASCLTDLNQYRVEISSNGLPHTFTFPDGPRSFTSTIQDATNMRVDGLRYSTVQGFEDADNDGIDDAVDNCPTASNFDQKDLDGDGKGNVCDSDRDGDGVLDAAEPIVCRDSVPDPGDPANFYDLVTRRFKWLGLNRGTLAGDSNLHTKEPGAQNVGVAVGHSILTTLGCTSDQSLRNVLAIPDTTADGKNLYNGGITEGLILQVEDKVKTLPL